MKQNKLYIVLLILGISILFCPLILKAMNQNNQTYTITKYTDEVEKMDDTEIKKKKKKYEKYNKELMKNGKSSIDLFKKGEILGYIKIEKIKVFLPIFEGTDDKNLLKGVGHLENTSLPVGKASYHSILVGHTGISTKKLFDNLVHLKKGDTFAVTILNDTFKYRVIDIKKVLPEQTKDLRIRGNKKLVTLVTCTPKYVNSHRLLVTGEKILNL